jgi:hypothetical protein
MAGLDHQAIKVALALLRTCPDDWKGTARNLTYMVDGKVVFCFMQQRQYLMNPFASDYKWTLTVYSPGCSGTTLDLNWRETRQAIKAVREWEERSDAVIFRDAIAAVKAKVFETEEPPKAVKYRHTQLKRSPLSQYAYDRGVRDARLNQSKCPFDEGTAMAKHWTDGYWVVAERLIERSKS